MRIFYIKFRFNDISATYILRIKKHSIKTRLKNDIFYIIFSFIKKYTENSVEKYELPCCCYDDNVWVLDVVRILGALRLMWSWYVSKTSEGLLHACISSIRRRHCDCWSHVNDATDHQGCYRLSTEKNSGNNANFDSADWWSDTSVRWSDTSVTWSDTSFTCIQCLDST